MSRHKANPELPSGLTDRERYHYLKLHGLCVSCGINEANNGVHCDTCHARNLANNHKQYERFRLKREQRKTIQAKQDYFDFCIEQATKLKLSYGEYMALKHEGRV